MSSITMSSTFIHILIASMLMPVNSTITSHKELREIVHGGAVGACLIHSSAHAHLGGGGGFQPPPVVVVSDMMGPTQVGGSSPLRGAGL